jgi:hypothetical protein
LGNALVFQKNGFATSQAKKHGDWSGQMRLSPESLRGCCESFCNDLVINEMRPKTGGEAFVLAS